MLPNERLNLVWEGVGNQSLFIRAIFDVKPNSPPLFLPILSLAENPGSM